LKGKAPHSPSRYPSQERHEENTSFYARQESR
jgi:hypothetical protein